MPTLNKSKTLQKVSTTSIAIIVIPIGITLLQTNFWQGFALLVLGAACLIIRELKPKETTEKPEE